MDMLLSLSPHGRLYVEGVPDQDAASVSEVVSKRLGEAFAQDTAHGLLHLATVELESNLPAAFSFARDWGRAYLTQLCHRP